ncbi:DUF4395 domain-containing protein [Thiothrix lacustris]|uniref:DUF4395 domain-containing protein n=1 Tax=Thiothrix lacustris TaxID=525917 RepID=A0ABY9MLI4_9GAMM|nr:DUF4395 domain-containing protein [Thiothrix lacustris]WML89412.1 DUF4395 domain-containing protein [Thiothrix lacustris]
MVNWFVSCCKNLWFRDLNEEKPYINDTAVRIRAGLLMAIPMYMALTLYVAIFGSRWVVTGDVITDTLETDFDGHIIYGVEAIKRTLDYSTQTWVLFYALFEMLAGMSVKTSRLSPTILLSSFLAKGSRPVWKPLTPKRFAWSIGASFIVVCLVFFNPEVVAGWVNGLMGHEVLPPTENYMPRWIPLVMVWVCFGFMWMETVLGFCAGCKVHALLVWMGVLEEECEACNNLDWGDAASKN